MGYSARCGAPLGKALFCTPLPPRAAAAPSWGNFVPPHPPKPTLQRLHVSDASRPRHFVASGSAGVGAPAQKKKALQR